ncbi:unnamed protein product [Orchesella dallaii]|uniref:[histone H3]-trimethyl-L-lysine(4) demethylase n=1 Tax=Orchesella dallaii TaxID=48710 RepID=A0ABP1QHL9_9HEXA
MSDSIAVNEVNRKIFTKMSDDDEFQFQRPPEAETFYPTYEEFKDPLQYIRKIYPVAVGMGICKIKPPPGWTPPFSVSMDEFTFTPRVQKINELEATTRIRMNFMTHITKFWEIQGTPLEIPVLEGRQVDLYTLHQQVHSSEFKIVKISEDRKWELITSRMGLKTEGQTGQDMATQLKSCFERILRPYDVWKLSNESKSAIKSRKPRKGRADTRTSMRYRSKIRPHLISNDCRICNKSDQNELLKCTDCHLKYHASCLKLAPGVACEETWRCTDCVSNKLKDLNEEYGFEQAVKQYTLQDFKEMADKFKAAYFERPANEISSEELENEFWRIVSTVGENVVVEYGADIHGSGFPTQKTNNAADFPEYVNSGWNLNNLPVRHGSAFNHIKSDVSGMKSPWVYVGMCFSTFCWHNEDHWSYSISYLHRGATKTWYGVPGGKAMEFEQAMRNAAPELFEKAPDLLHRLVTLINPNILMKAKIPIHRVDQNPGEFIITFPRSYHAGFNQGFNVAEAVNFAPADWVQMGRQCVQNYSRINRVCVFSHDELICEMAKEPELMDYHLVLATYNDLLEVLIVEKKLRIEAIQRGIKACERFEFENIEDDQRQCDVCKTTLFLSGITCSHIRGSGSPEKFVCLNHFEQYVCKDCKIDPTKHVLKYRYTLDELLDTVRSLKRKLELYAMKVKCVSLKMSNDKLPLEDLRLIVQEMEQSVRPETPKKQEQPSSDEPSSSRSVVSLRLRKTSSQFQDTKFKLNVAEFRTIQKIENVDIIPRVPFKDFMCTKDEIDDLKKILEEAELWEERVSEIFTSSEKTTEAKVGALLEQAESISVSLPGVTKLRILGRKVKAWKDKAFKARVPDYPTSKTANLFRIHDVDAAELLNQGDLLPVQLDLLEKLKSTRTRVMEWRANCTRSFLPFDSSLELIEVLVPRTAADPIPFLKRKHPPQSKSNTTVSASFLVSQLTNLSLQELKEYDKLMPAIEQSLDDECSILKKIRLSNQQKIKNTKFHDCWYCNEAFDISFGIQCELCLEWYHRQCFLKFKSYNESTEKPITDHHHNYDGSALFYELVEASSKYIGPCCIRSSRPINEKLEELPLDKEAGVVILPIECYYLIAISSRRIQWLEKWNTFAKQIKMLTAKGYESMSLEYENINDIFETLEDLMIEVALLPVKSYGEDVNGFWDCYFLMKHKLTSSRDWSPHKNLIPEKPAASKRKLSPCFKVNSADNSENNHEVIDRCFAYAHPSKPPKVARIIEITNSV